MARAAAAAQSVEPPALAPGDRRRHTRHRLLWSGMLQTADGPYPCIVLDISLGGAMVSLPRAPRRGDPVSLVLGPLGAFRGELVWQKDRVVGVSFREVPAAVARLIGEQLAPTAD